MQMEFCLEELCGASEGDWLEYLRGIDIGNFRGLRDFASPHKNNGRGGISLARSGDRFRPGRVAKAGRKTCIALVEGLLRPFHTLHVRKVLGVPAVPTPHGSRGDNRS